MELNTFVDLSTLMGLSGASAVTATIVAVIEKIFGKKLSSQLLSLIVAVAITAGTCVFAGDSTAESYFLAVINSFLVAAASNGIYDAAVKFGGGRRT